MSISFRMKPRKQTNALDNGWAGLFYEDLCLSFFPPFFERDPKYRVFAHGDERHFDQALGLLDRFSQRHYRGPKEPFKELFEQVLYQLIWKGEAYFEIEKLPNGGFVLCRNAYGDTLHRKLGLYWKKTRHYHGYSQEEFEYSLVKDNSVWKVKLPREICSSRKQSRIMNALRSNTASYPEDMIPSFGQKSNFNLQEYNQLKIVATLRVSEPWGWDGRYSIGDNLTEYHRLFLNLKFKWALSILREHIEAELNRLIKRLGYDVRLRVYGFDSSYQARELVERMRNGKLSFEEGYENLNVPETLDQ